MSSSARHSLHDVAFSSRQRVLELLTSPHRHFTGLWIFYFQLPPQSRLQALSCALFAGVLNILYSDLQPSSRLPHMVRAYFSRTDCHRSFARETIVTINCLFLLSSNILLYSSSTDISQHMLSCADRYGLCRYISVSCRFRWTF